MGNVNTKTYPTALGYLRISDKKQIKGESKATQKAAITKYAFDNKLNVIEWFYDEAKSGKNTERDELQSMLKVIMKSKIDYVIVYKMSRASRDMESYQVGMRSILSLKGVKIRSVTEQFDDSPTGRFVENLHVMVAQLDNETKREFVVDNMTALSKQGYWQHKPLRGYDKHRIVNSEGKERPSMKPNEEAPLITDILNRFSRADLKVSGLCKYATSIGFRSVKGKPISQESLTQILKRPEYAGFVHDKFTDYELVDGRHQELISPDVFWLNQEILKMKNKPYLLGVKHEAINDKVPLRPFMLCVNCKRHVTSSNPGGKYRYFCHRKSCRGTGSVLAELAHERFIELLEGIQPSERTVELMKTIISRTAMKELSSVNQELVAFREKLSSIDKLRIETIKEAVQKRITDEDKRLVLDDLELDRETIGDQIYKLEQKQLISEENIIFTLDYLKDIAGRWINASTELQQNLLTLIFPEGFEYDMKTNNFIINEISPLYRCNPSVLEAENVENSTVVIPRRIELRLPG